MGDGACWAFITERFKIFIYGFYPEPERWRAILAFVLMFVAIGPLLFDKFPYRGKALLFSIAYPFISAWLLLGGFGLNPAAPAHHLVVPVALGQ